MRGVRPIACGVMLAAGLFATAAQADYTVSFAQVGNDVVATGSGSFDAGLLGFSIGSGPTPGTIDPNGDVVITGPSSGTASYLVGLTGPSAFGSGGSTSASSGSGDIVGLEAYPNPGGVGSGLLDLPTGYVAGATLNDTSTYSDATFASLGLTPGTYVYDLSLLAFGPRGHRPNGPATVDTFTIDIPGPVGVPEPSGLAAITLGMVVLAVTRHRRSARAE